MTRQSRRSFLKTAVAGGAALAAGATAFAAKDKKNRPKSSGNILGANQRVRVAVAGINGRGRAHLAEYARIAGVEIACVVDPDARLLKASKYPGEKDIRKVLEDKNIDAVSVATPNHWHALITVWACQHGKDVYVEKPCSHTFFEGQQCVAAARKYDRIVQHGTQSRSSDGVARTVAAVRSGRYGKLLAAKAYASKPRWSIGYKPSAPVPDWLDYNLWLGPAPETPFHANLVHYNWHWFWAFGNGEIGNQGVHQMDVARWGIAGAPWPQSVISLGGRFVDGPGCKDQGETPNMQLAVFDFGGPLLVFEVRGLVGRKNFAPKVENEFYLEEGKIVGGKFYPKGKSKGEPLAEVDYHRPQDGHFGNFIRCVHDRKPENLNAPILEGHRSAALCHLANISYRLGREVPFGPRPAEIGDCPQTLESLQAIEDNLSGALGLKLSEHQYRLGAKLRFDGKTERFVDNAEANKLLTREYRKPFVVEAIEGG